MKGGKKRICLAPKMASGGSITFTHKHHLSFVSLLSQLVLDSSVWTEFGRLLNVAFIRLMSLSHIHIVTVAHS